MAEGFDLNSLNEKRKRVEFYENNFLKAHKLYFMILNGNIEFCSADDVIEDKYYKNKVFSIRSGAYLGDKERNPNIYPLFVPIEGETILDKKIQKDVFKFNDLFIKFCNKNKTEGDLLKEFFSYKLKKTTKGYIDLYKKKYTRSKIVNLENKINYYDNNSERD